MGSYARNCNRFREGTVMEEAAEVVPPGKKRKIGFEESDRSTSSVQLKTPRLATVTPVNSGNSTSESASFDDVLGSCCSSNGSSELAKLGKNGEHEVAVDHYSATSIGDSTLDCIERREATPSSSAGAEPETELEQSTARPEEPMPLGRVNVEKLSIKDDLEEFFAAAEKNLQKQFMDKYNYDVVKDQPLEGRFEWTQIQQKP